MKRRAPRPQTSGHSAPHDHSANHCRAIMLVDGAGIRKKTKKDYEKAMRDIDHSRRQLDQFHQTDLPQFTRGMQNVWGDIYDYWFVRLDQGTTNEMQHQFVFAQPKDVDVNEYPLEGDWYSFSGFPYRKRKIVGKSVLSPLCSYHLQAAPKDVYINLGVNPYSHIICNFDRKRYTGAGAGGTRLPR